MFLSPTYQLVLDVESITVFGPWVDPKLTESKTTRENNAQTTWLVSDFVQNLLPRLFI